MTEFYLDQEEAIRDQFYKDGYRYGIAARQPEINALIEQSDTLIRQRNQHRREVHTLKAERDKYRAALERIANAPAWGAPDKWEPTPFEVRQLAREALK